MSKSSKKDPIYGLEKIPDKAWIKLLEARIRELETEKGKLLSYIDELEHDKKELSKLTTEEFKEFKKDLIFDKINKEKEALAYKVYTLKRDIKRLIEKNINLQNQIKDGK